MNDILIEIQKERERRGGCTFGTPDCTCDRGCYYGQKCWDTTPPSERFVKLPSGQSVPILRSGCWVVMKDAPKHYHMSKCNGHTHLVTFSGFDSEHHIWVHTDCAECNSAYQITGEGVVYLVPRDPPPASEIIWPDVYIPEECKR